MLQDVLGDTNHLDTLEAADLRGLTPLFWSHIAPYSEVRLRMNHRLDLAS